MTKEFFYEYDEVLIGHGIIFPPSIFEPDATYINKKISLGIIKYAFETYLGWSPEVLCDEIDMHLMDVLKLTQFLTYIPFPDGLDKKKDLFYLICMIYPKQIYFTDDELVIRVYKSMISGERQKYPKEFFTGIDGMYRAKICLRYLIDAYAPVHTKAQLYEFFADPLIMSFLRKYYLHICKDLYMSPLHYLHDMLGAKQDNCLFLYYLSKNDRENAKMMLAEQEGFE